MSMATQDVIDRIADLEAQLCGTPDNPGAAETTGSERALFLAQIAAMRPVVEAACACRFGQLNDRNLEQAVDAYRNAAQPPAAEDKCMCGHSREEHRGPDHSCVHVHQHYGMCAYAVFADSAQRDTPVGQRGETTSPEARAVIEAACAWVEAEMLHRATDPVHSQEDAAMASVRVEDAVDAYMASLAQPPAEPAPTT